MLKLAAGFALGALWMWLFLWSIGAVVPKCEEDQVIAGVGDFADGRWSSYECATAVAR